MSDVEFGCFVFIRIVFSFNFVLEPTSGLCNKTVGGFVKIWRMRLFGNVIVTPVGKILR